MDDYTGVKKNIVKGTDFILKGEDDEAINYFVDIVPRMERKYGSNLQIVQFLQYPGI
jgi:histone arginine demethylase JMJD6